MTITTISPAVAEQLAVQLEYSDRPVAAAAMRALSAERDALAADNARLREALTWVLRDVQEWCNAIDQHSGNWDSWDHYYKSFQYGGIEKARAALGARAS